MNNKIVPINVKSFSKVNTPESAYMLGLLWADGYIHPPYSVVIECLSADMIELQEIFYKIGKWNKYERSRKNRQPQTTFQLTNRDLVSYLIEHDYSAKNSKSACSIIDTIPEKLLCYWFRGLVDGDGCFYMSSDKISRQFCITSSYEQDWTYMEDVFKKLNVRYKIKHQISKSGNKSSQIRVTSPFDIKSFGEWIYQNYEKDKIGLPRKYEKWKLISESCIAKKLKTKG